MKQHLLTTLVILGAICAYAGDYTLDFTGRKGNNYWDSDTSLWSGGAEDSEWYPYPEPDAQGNLPNLKINFGEKANLYCYGYVDKRTFPMLFNSVVVNNANYNILGKGGVVFGIGAEGFTAEKKFGEMEVDISLLASQTWKQMEPETGSGKSLIKSPVSAGENVVWTIAGAARFLFSDNKSNTLGQYKAQTYSNAGLFLSGTNQFNRFGTGTLTLTAEKIEGLDSCPRLVFHYPQGADGSIDVETPIVLDFKTPNSQSFPLNWIGLACDDSESDMSVNITQPMRGQIGHRSLLLGQTGHHQYKQFHARYSDVGLYRGDQQRLVLSGDNSGLIPYGSEARKQILVTTILSAAHKNALGTDNAAFDIEFSAGMFDGLNGVFIRGITGLTTRNGVSIGANLTGLRLASGANKALGHMPTVLLGTDDDGKSVFSGSYRSVKSTREEIETWRYDAVPGTSGHHPRYRSQHRYRPDRLHRRSAGHGSGSGHLLHRFLGYDGRCHRLQRVEVRHPRGRRCLLPALLLP